MIRGVSAKASALRGAGLARLCPASDLAGGMTVTPSLVGGPRSFVVFHRMADVLRGLHGRTLFACGDLDPVRIAGSASSTQLVDWARVSQEDKLMKITAAWIIATAGIAFMFSSPLAAQCASEVIVAPGNKNGAADPLAKQLDIVMAFFFGDQ